MKIHNTRLEAKVAARNRVNALALEKLPAILAALLPFVGKKVQLASGQIADKVKKTLPELENNSTTRGIYNSSRYAVRVAFKVLEASKSNHPDTTIAAYAETDVSLGELDPTTGVLVKLASGHSFRTDYTVEEIQQLRKEARIAQDAMHDAEFQLAGFGEHDN